MMTTMGDRHQGRAVPILADSSEGSLRLTMTLLAEGIGMMITTTGAPREAIDNRAVGMMTTVIHLDVDEVKTLV